MDLDLMISNTYNPNIVVPDDERLWDLLISQVINGNVIPVIGTELTNCEGESISDILVRNISSLCNMKDPANNFSQLIPRFNVERKNDDIYRFIYGILSKDANQKLTTPSKDLIKLLSIKYFPFVIYTSYDPTVEKAMRCIHGENLRIYSFDNNADTNDDIPIQDNLKTPTIYYIFGKANGDGQRFVLSDKDMLDFASSWLVETDNTSKAKPANLSNTLANKFLLVLGCNYNDWLFRFIWFAMKNNKIKRISNDEQKIGLLTVNHKANDELIDFLMRSNTLTQTIPLHDFIEELRSRVSLKENLISKSNLLLKFDKPRCNTDVFISYSRSDKKLVEQLYSIMTDMGIDVWYDKNNLGVGSEFWKDIRHAIRTTKIFVPILTSSIKKQYREEHVYRDEWYEAIIRKRRLGKVTYICPLCTDDFNIEDKESDIPETLKTHNVYTISLNSVDDCLLGFAKEIWSELLALKEYD